MRKVSIIHPSRCRPQKAFQRRNEWLSNAVTDIEYIVSVDHDDPMLGEYVTLFSEDIIEINHNRSLVDATNNGALKATGDLFVVVSDDFFCFPAWDASILKAVEGKEDFVLKTYDGQQTWIVTLPVLDRKFHESLGYIYFPGYFHMFSDTDMTHIADVTGRLIIRNDIVFVHDNPSYKNDQKNIDDLHRRNNSQERWRRDSKLYINRIRTGFGLGINAMNLSKNVHPGFTTWLAKNGVMHKTRENRLRQTPIIRRK